MKLRNLAIGAAAMSLAAAPAIAEVDLDRAAAPVEGESEVGAAVYGVAGLAALATAFDPSTASLPQWWDLVW